jgi:glycosyltransferase involved in cell wall biosynthesis/ubiquinone/menaquinone biosynthesis C-methylase UbiE
MSVLTNNKKVIVVLPAYNAEKTLEKTVKDIPKDWIDDIILVDDASKDKTVEVSKKLGLKTFVHKKNSGYGANQKTCYKEALKLGADIVVMVHPDFQYDPAFIPQMIKPIARDETDAVFGSRMLIPTNALKGGMPYWKFLANIFLTKLENFVLGMNLTEYHSGFRAYSRKVLELPIELNSDNFVFDTEIIAQLKVAKMKIREIPITTRYFPEASMIGFRRSVNYGLSILLVMGRYLLNKFGLIKYSQFNFNVSKNHICRLCGEKKSQFFLKGNIRLENYFKEKYLITEEKTGHSDIYRCLNCDLRFVLQEFAEKTGDIMEFYKNSPLDEIYLKDLKGRQKNSRRILKNIENFRFPLAAGKILDFGCGPGLFLAEAEKFGYEIHGVELSERAVDYARERLNLDSVKRGGEEKMEEFPDNYFDVITALDVLEHVQFLAPVLDKIHSKLKPGGIFAATFPKIDTLPARLLKNYWYAMVPSHLSYFSEKSTQYLIDRSNWELVDKRYYKRYFSISYLIKRLFKNNKLALPEFSWLTFPINTFTETEVYLRKSII